jgi:hypothetical protein
VGEQGFSPGRVLLLLTLLMIVLGSFIDGISIVVLTTSVLMPVIETAKIDPLWFGIYMVEESRRLVRRARSQNIGGFRDDCFSGQQTAAEIAEPDSGCTVEVVGPVEQRHHGSCVKQDVRGTRHVPVPSHCPTGLPARPALV